MKITKLVIKGSNLKKLVNLLKEQLDSIKKEYDDDYYLHASDNNFVFATQRFFFRVESNLLSVMVLNFKNERECAVEIVSGGGGAGIFGITLNSEASANNKIVKNLEKLCNSNSWKITQKA